MLKALVAVDGSISSDRAVKHAIALVHACPSMEILLLNIQEPIDDWQVRRFLKPEEIDAIGEAKGGDALKSARTMLDAAKVRYTPSVLIGPVAETIARFAREQGCDGIVIGTRGLGGVESLVLGSVSTKVIHLAEVPVTLVK